MGLSPEACAALSAAKLDTGVMSAEYVPGGGLLQSPAGRKHTAFSAAGRTPKAAFHKHA
jgi:hypothetical protein